MQSKGADGHWWARDQQSAQGQQVGLRKYPLETIFNAIPALRVRSEYRVVTFPAKWKYETICHWIALWSFVQLVQMYEGEASLMLRIYFEKEEATLARVRKVFIWLCSVKSDSRDHLHSTSLSSARLLTWMNLSHSTSSLSWLWEEQYNLRNPPSHVYAPPVPVRPDPARSGVFIQVRYRLKRSRTAAGPSLSDKLYFSSLRSLKDHPCEGPQPSHLARPLDLLELR